jgi:hypothetical protein
MPNEQYVPKSVQEAADRADQILKDRNTDPNKPVETPAGTAPEPETVESLTAEIQRLKHSQEVLQGKYDKEVKALGDNPKLLQGLREMNRKLMGTNETLSRSNSDLLAEVKELRKRLEAAPPATRPEDRPPATQPEVDPLDVFTEDEIDVLKENGLNDTSLKILAKRTKAATATGTAPPAEIQELRDRLKKFEEKDAQSEQAKFDASIQAVHPEWDNGLNSAINQDPDFFEFLGPENSIRRRIINAAYADSDVQGVCDFLSEFKDWKKKKGNGKPKDEPKETPKPKTDKLLEQPATGPAAEVSLDASGKRTYTTAWVKEFYKLQQIRSGNGQGVQALPELGLTTEQAQAIDRDLTVASSEGRIR